MKEGISINNSSNVNVNRKKEFLNNTLISLYYLGVVKKEDMAKLETLNKDYNIEIERKDFRLWSTNYSYRYLCKFYFKNNFGINILELTTCELDIFSLIDCMSQFYEDNLNDIAIHFNAHNLNLEQFIFKFTRNGNNNINLLISIYNPIYQIIINKLNIEFDEKKFLDFVDIMYFVFLIDIDNETYSFENIY